MSEKRIGVADQIPFIGILDFVIVAAGRRKIRSNPGLCVSDALAQDLIDGKRQVIGIFRNGGIVVQNRDTVGGVSGGQPPEDNGGQHKDEQDR